MHQNETFAKISHTQTEPSREIEPRPLYRLISPTHDDQNEVEKVKSPKTDENTYQIIYKNELEDVSLSKKDIKGLVLENLFSSSQFPYNIGLLIGPIVTINILYGSVLHVHYSGTEVLIHLFLAFLWLLSIKCADDNTKRYILEEKRSKYVHISYSAKKLAKYSKLEHLDKHVLSRNLLKSVINNRNMPTEKAAEIISIYKDMSTLAGKIDCAANKHVYTQDEDVINHIDNLISTYVSLIDPYILP